MSEIRYKYNIKTLSYEKEEVSLKAKLVKLISFTATGLVFAVIFIFLANTYYESPKERVLREKEERLGLQYEELNSRLDQMDKVLGDVQNRDDNIYRVIFEAEPIPKNIREAGIGGVNRYKHLEEFAGENGAVIETTKRLDKIAKQLYIQSKSFDEVYEMAKQKEKMLASIPAIQPISNSDLKRMSSGFGMRFHPIYKTPKFHHGMDFTAPTGTEIYATGQGVVEKTEINSRGYGNHVVVNHGYGYKTLYGHMSRIAAKPGQKINRGDVIGYVGNTGASSAPHLHYEVIKDNVKINPVNFYFDDLTPEEYDIMIQISSAENQSFD